MNEFAPLSVSDSTTEEATATTGPVAWDTEPYSTKRHGLSITHCESEPIRTPGCIQAHGALLVLRPSDLSVLQASENTQAILGHGPVQLLGHSVAVVVKPEGATRLLSILATEQTERNPVYAFTLPANGAVAALDVTLHTIDGVAMLEFEAAGRSQRAMGTSPLPLSPLHTPDYYSFIKKSVTRLQTADTVQGFCQALADEVRVLSGLDRVMIYKFHADHHGEVVAESRLNDLVPWLGQHYPAEDIPNSARDIFAKTWIRPVPDIHGQLAEMTPLVNPDTGKPVDMTFCALRGASAMYTRYLQNMGVSAGLTMSLRRESVLWGLIICHRYSGAYHVPYELRAACEFLAQVASLQYRAVEDRENAAYRVRLEEVNQQLLRVAAQEGGLASMTDGEPSLLSAMHAGGAALFHRDRWWQVGQTPNESQLAALGQWVVGQLDVGSVVTSPVYATHALTAAYPPGAAFADVASGVLAAPLSRSGQNLMMWFRPEVQKTVNWGGNPSDKPQVTGPDGSRLSPRQSFEPFSESVYHHSTPWLDVEIDAVSRLRSLIMELVIVRAERLAGLNADLARSNEDLDAFAYVASHDLKEPLRGIYKYAHQLLEAEPANEEEKRKLDGLVRLTLRMDSLLDSLLYFSRVGREVLTLENVDMNGVLADAIEMVGSRTGDLRTHIVAPRPLPSALCDRIRVREVLVNLLSNALKYNDKDSKYVEVGYVGTQEPSLRSGFPAGTEGQTVFYVRDNGIGIASRHFEQVFKMFKRLHGREDFGGGTGAGLTIVRKLVERHRGQVWIESVAGEGSTFFFTTGKPDDT